MSCKVNIKLTQDLVDRNIISEDNKILDNVKFSKINELYTKVAKDSYNFDTYGKLLYNVKDSKAVPDGQLMDLYNEIVVEYEKEHPEDIFNTYRSIDDIPSLMKDIENNKNFIKGKTKSGKLVDIDSGEEYEVYHNTKTGKDYKRVTNFISGKTDEEIKLENESNKDNKILKSAQTIGTKIDVFVRDYFAGELQPFAQYDVAGEADLSKFIGELDKIKAHMDSRGEVVLANDIILYNDDIGVAGTVDLISYDEKGVIRIYDMKTMRGNNFETSIYGNKYDSTAVFEKIEGATKANGEPKYKVVRGKKQDSKRTKHAKQLSMYRILLNNTHGLNAQTLEVIPIEIAYKGGDTSTSKLKLLPKVNMSMYSTIESASFDTLSTTQFKDNQPIKNLTDLEATSEQNFLDVEEETKANRPQREYYDLSTIEKRQKKVLDGIKDNLEESIKKYDTLIKKLKDPSKIKIYSDKLKKVFSDLEAYDEANNWMAISTFVGELSRNINSLKQNFNKEDLNADDIKKTIDLYQKYLMSHALVKDISKFVSDAKAEGDFSIPKNDIIELQDQLSDAEGQFDTLNRDLKALQKKGIANILNDKKFASEVLHNWKIKLEKQHSDLNIQENKTTWVNKQMNGRYKDEIDADVKENANKLVNDVHFDINNATKWLVSGISTNSKMIQVLQNIINTVRDNIIKRNRDNDFKLKDLFDKYIAKLGNKKMSALYDKLLEYDKDGNAWLKGDYTLKFRETYQAKLKEYNSLKVTTESKYGTNSPEYNNLYKHSEFKKWVAENTKEESDEFGTSFRTPIKKWHNDLSKLSEIEQQVLLEFRDISKTTSRQTFGIKSIVSKRLFGGTYYNLPAVTKSGLERTLEGNFKGTISDKWHDLTEVRPDDIGYETSKNDIANNPVYDVKINFRGKLKPNQQSLDLFTIYRLEARNGVNFDEKHNAEGTVSTLVDVAKEKDFYKHTGVRVPILNINAKRNKIATIKGENSITYKRMVSLMESNIYDIMHKDGGKLGKLDVNKVVGAANGWTAKIGMWVNEIAGTVNVLNGKAQLFLQTIAGDHIKGSSLAKAEKIYFKNLPENMKDISSPIKTSFTNQVNEMFDTFGITSTSVEQAFIKNTLAKATINEGSLQFIQESGEHWLQSTLTMGVLDTIKVLDKDGNFMSKDGTIVEEENAASLLDMLTKVDGKLTLNKNVVYTTKTMGIEYDKGGKEAIMNLVKAKIFATMGNYDSNMQPEVMRHWYGKLFMMFRKYFIELGLDRYRGAAFAHRKQEDLFDEERFYSEAEQEYIEGTYVSAVRYGLTSVIPALKALNFKLLSTDWKALTDYEKKNIHKTITEIGITMALLPAIGSLLAAIKGDDDDKEYIWFLMLTTRRLESEISAYRDIREQYKILNSPIPSLRLVQNTMNIIGSLSSPGSWGDKIQGTDNLKIGKDFKRMLPILNKTNSTYKQKYQYMMYMAN